MVVTLDTFHLARSPLNADALANMANMLVTLDTSHDPIGPCGPLEQSKSDAFGHSAMAARSSAFDLGAQAAREPSAGAQVVKTITRKIRMFFLLFVRTIAVGCGVEKSVMYINEAEELRLYL